MSETCKKTRPKKKVVKIGSSVDKVVISFQKTQRKGKVKNARKFKVPREAAQVTIRTPKKRKTTATKPKSEKPKVAKPKTATVPKPKVRKVVKKHRRVSSKKKKAIKARYRELKKFSGW